MPRKVPASTTKNGEAIAVDTPAVMSASMGEARAPVKKGSESLDDLTSTGLRAFLIARDAAFNMRDLLTNSSRMAFLAIKECEQELDIIERYIDERLPAAIKSMRPR